MQNITFIDFDICHLMVSLTVVVCDLDLHFKGKQIVNVNVLEKVRVIKKMRNMTLIDFDICHRMIPFRKLYSTTLDYIFKSNIF